MMETILVAVVFMVLLIVALAFYFRFSSESLGTVAERACLVSNTVLLSSVATLPEIGCSVEGQRLPCVDTTKLVLFDAGREGLPFSTLCPQRITFSTVYPVPEKAVPCTENTYPDCTDYAFYEPEGAPEEGIAISTPVTLYYPLTDTYTVGRLTIEIIQ